MVEIVNNYVPPPPKGPVVLPDPNEPFDINFRYPVRELESDRLKLVPFVPSVHGQTFFKRLQSHPEIYEYLPWNPSNTVRDFEEHFETKVRSDPTWFVFAVLDKSKIVPGQADPPRALIAVESSHALAGTIGYLRAAPELASVEIGYVIVLPAYQRTFVSTHAIGLVLQYALEQPKHGGLGLRRVQWQAHADNAVSIRAAQRMGLKLEGVLRWDRIVSIDKVNAIRAREDDVLPLPGRHTAMLAMCWDDWESGGREHVQKMMERTS
ncbi:hypothetical protein CTheo_1638 [Ceratobasidium theobromae]|uniref:N-acetyltransferase domain-containing protein n=1 Tax=Ceratobasidium theobromae TaxID=1582974 RepID=A0A5N5QTB7_9AGAM|nr:hypothetical protein CTheo_1638 [Ceratobasidium theobromae]